MKKPKTRHGKTAQRQDAGKGASGGRPRRYGTGAYRRVAMRWPVDLDRAMRAHVGRQGGTVSLLVRRAVLAYLLAEEGPALVRAFAVDLLDGAHLAEVAASDPRSAARQAFRA